MTTAAATDPRIAGWADKIMAAIDADIQAGYVPAWVYTFAGLHDHTDANMYVLDALHDDFPPFDHAGDEYPDGSKLSGEHQAAADAEHNAGNAVMDEVDRRLRQRRPAGCCRTCGNTVNGYDQCACWCLIAQALQQYAGADHDGSADQAARIWDGLDMAAKEAVWTAAYAQDHFQGDGGPIPIYDPPAELAALQAQDRLAFPHAEPCPRCGRRQWGGPDPYVTCTHCGHVYEGSE